MRTAFRLGLALALFATSALAQISVPRSGSLNSAQPVFCVNPTTGTVEDCATVTLSGPVTNLPPGTPETASSGNVANGVVAATLAASAGKTTYISGLHMSADGATTALGVDCTITGIVTGTQTFTFGYGTLLAYSVRDIYFNPPMPASAANTTIVASCPAGGTGAAHAAMSVEGFQY